MIEFKLRIECGNEAFQTERQRITEVARILAETSARLLEGSALGTIPNIGIDISTAYLLRDYNGNTVGHAGFVHVLSDQEIVSRTEQAIRDGGPIALYETEHGFAFAWGRVPEEHEVADGTSETLTGVLQLIEASTAHARD